MNNTEKSTQDSKKTYLFEEMPVSQAILKLSAPTVIGCLVMILYNLADTYFVGMLNSPVQTAAVTLGGTLILAFNAVTNLFGTGTASVMSRALGTRDYETFKRTSAFGFYAGLVCALLFSLAAAAFTDPILELLGAKPENIDATREYVRWTVMFGAAPAISNIIMGNLIRSEGSAAHASIGTMAGCLLNIVLDPFFILPQYLDMGAAGAGLATCISNCVACAYFFILLAVKKGKTFVTINPGYMKPTRRILKEVFGVGIPASIQNLLNVTGMTVLNNFGSAYGTAAVAALGISHKVTMIPMYVSMGIAQGVMPLIGYNFASKNRLRMNETITRTARISIGFMIAATAAMYAGSAGLMNMFIEDAQTVTFGTAFMHAMSLAQPFFALDFLGVGIYQACGMGKTSLFFAIARKIVLEIPALVILNKTFGVNGLPYAQLCSEVVLAVAAVICIKKIMEKDPV